MFRASYMPIQGREVFLAVILMAALAAALLFHAGGGAPASFAPVPAKEVDTAINSGIDFLYGAQLDYGEFKTQACQDEEMTDCYFDSSPFSTTFIIYALKGIENDKVKPITDKALGFLRGEEEPGGIWRYWTNRNPQKAYRAPDDTSAISALPGTQNPTQLDPDLDDMSTVSYALKSNGVSFDDNTALFEKNRDDQGRFLTWIRTGPEVVNDVDCGVNANALLYLGNDPQACLYVNASVESAQYQCSTYYPDPLVFYYLVSRAEAEGASCLSASKEVLVKKVLSLQKKDGSFGNALDTAAALNVLINDGYTGKEVNGAASYLLGSQGENGSWPRYVSWTAPFPYYGSEEFTTALSMEALNKYLDLQNISASSSSADTGGLPERATP